MRSNVGVNSTGATAAGAGGGAVGGAAEGGGAGEATTEVEEGSAVAAIGLGGNGETCPPKLLLISLLMLISSLSTWSMGGVLGVLFALIEFAGAEVKEKTRGGVC